MKDLSESNNSYRFGEILEILEKIKLSSNFNRQENGIVYTPLKIADFMTKNILKIYLIDIINHSFSKHYEKSISYRELLRILKSIGIDKRRVIFERFAHIKVLDPSCGSGIFLLTVAKNLFNLFKILQPGHLKDDLKRLIINNNIFGVEIDHSALLISKLRILEWYVRDLEIDRNKELKIANIEKKLNEISKHLNLNFKFWNQDFLLDFRLKEFNIIVGNPPYVENKKIKDKSYKKRLTKFNTAFGLYDLSILFVEKSLDILNPQFGYLSFLITNKFLAADYGKKIRKKIIIESQILEISDVSSLSLFRKTAIYPVIISLSKKTTDSDTIIRIVNSKSENNNLNLEKTKIIKISQNSLQNYPAYVIPISPDLELVNRICNKYAKMSSIFKDLIVIYRPFGFINWAKNIKLIQSECKSKRDLLILGTGNVGKYHIKFEKEIRIANQKFNLSYFPYDPKFDQLWSRISSEKLLIREIAKKITAVYDPGIFTNFTGIYSILIPSLSTNQYFSLLTILNSEIVNTIFNSLYGTLHMAGGYLRYNGSFLKRLPLPSFLPSSLGYLGKILQFLTQLQYELKTNHNLNFETKEVSNLMRFFKRLSNSLVNSLYLDNLEDEELNKLLNSKNFFPKVKFKYFLMRFNLFKYQYYNSDELKNTFNKINEIFEVCNKNNNLLLEIQNSSKVFNNNK